MILSQTELLIPNFHLDGIKNYFRINIFRVAEKSPAVSV